MGDLGAIDGLTLAFIDFFFWNFEYRSVLPHVVGNGTNQHYVRNRCCTSIFLIICRIWDADRFGESGGLDAIGIDEEGQGIHIVIDRSYSASYRDLFEGRQCLYFFQI